LATTESRTTGSDILGGTTCIANAPAGAGTVGAGAGEGDWWLGQSSSNGATLIPAVLPGSSVVKMAIGFMVVLGLYGLHSGIGQAAHQGVPVIYHKQTEVK